MLADHMPMDLIMKYSELSEERNSGAKKGSGAGRRIIILC